MLWCSGLQVATEPSRIMQHSAKQILEESLIRYGAHNMLENEMDVQDEIYVMPLSSEQEQNMEAILSSVTCVLSMLMIEIVQFEGQYYEPNQPMTNIFYLTSLFNFHGRNVYNCAVDINHEDNITYIIMQYSQILSILRRFMLDFTNRWYVMPRCMTWCSNFLMQEYPSHL